MKAPAIYHITLKGKVLRRTYGEFAKRSAALAYYIKEKEHKRVGILATNTPAFLESVFGISGAGAVNVGKYEVNTRSAYSKFDME